MDVRDLGSVKSVSNTTTRARDASRAPSLYSVEASSCASCGEERRERRSGSVGHGEERRAARAAKRTEAFSFEQHPDWARLAAALRRQTEACVELDAEPEELASLADRAEALADALASHAGGKRVGLVEDGPRDGVGRPSLDLSLIHI